MGKKQLIMTPAKTPKAAMQDQLPVSTQIFGVALIELATSDVYLVYSLIIMLKPWTTLTKGRDSSSFPISVM
jgi:hypothetical protein